MTATSVAAAGGPARDDRRGHETDRRGARSARAARCAGASGRVVAVRPGAFRAALVPNRIASTSSRSASGGRRRVACCAPTYDPVAIARAYDAAGAAAISVLTEPTFFDGALEHLERRAGGGAHAAAAQGLHRLRISAARSACGRRRCRPADCRGADAGRAGSDLQHGGRGLGLDTLVEVHDADELSSGDRCRRRGDRRQQPQPADAGGRCRASEQI